MNSAPTVRSVEAPSTLTPAVAPAPVEAVRPGTVIEAPATVDSVAERLEGPLRIDWLGGSDVAWLDVSLPDAFVRHMPSFDGRPIEMRTRIRRAVMADGVAEMIGEATAADTDAIIMSINLVWRHWDQITCRDMTILHDKYECLLSPVDPEITAQRVDEMQLLIDTAVAAEVPVYIYVQPHSTDALDNPGVLRLVEDAEADVATYDPGQSDIRFVADVFTREMEPLVETDDFFDMVHPTEQGAERLVEWLAADIADHWTSVGLGR